MQTVGGEGKCCVLPLYQCEIAENPSISFQHVNNYHGDKIRATISQYINTPPSYELSPSMNFMLLSARSSVPQGHANEILICSLELARSEVGTFEALHGGGRGRA